MSITGKLTAAAASITSMPEAQITQRLDQLEAGREARSALARAQHIASIESLDLDWAAYDLAQHHDDAGDLPAAARWYKMAAANDFGDAALRLGAVLEKLAAQRAAAGPGGYASERDELALVCDAARWYAEAYAAGHPEAAGQLDGMICSHDIRRSRDTYPAQQADVRQEACEEGGLTAVVNGSDLTTATAHFRRCTPCQHEFLNLGGLLPAPHLHPLQEQLRATDASADTRHTLAGEHRQQVEAHR